MGMYALTAIGQYARKGNEFVVQKYSKVIRMILAIIIAMQVTVLHNIYTYKDPSLMVYYNNVMKVVNEYCKPDQYYTPTLRSVRFFDARSEGELAVCQIRPYAYSINVDSQSWKVLDEDDRIQIMAHEMIHCMFNQEHFTDAKHFMAPYMNKMSMETLDQQLRGYLQERCKDPNAKFEQ